VRFVDTITADCCSSDAAYAYQYCNNLFTSMLQVADDVIDINLQSAVSLC